MKEDIQNRDLKLIEMHLSGTISEVELEEFSKRWEDAKFQQQYFIIRGIKQGIEADAPDELTEDSLFKGKGVRILLGILVVLLILLVITIYFALRPQ